MAKLKRNTSQYKSFLNDIFGSGSKEMKEFEEISFEKMVKDLIENGILIRIKRRKGGFMAYCPQFSDNGVKGKNMDTLLVVVREEIEKGLQELKQKGFGDIPRKFRVERE